MHGVLSVTAPRITHQELTTVKNALEHPAPKAEGFATAASTLSALLAAGKIVLDVCQRQPPTPNPAEVVVFVVAVVVMGVLIYRYWDASCKQHPFHVQALSYVKELIGEEPRKPTS